MHLINRWKMCILYFVLLMKPCFCFFILNKNLFTLNIYMYFYLFLLACLLLSWKSVRTAEPNCSQVLFETKEESWFTIVGVKHTEFSKNCIYCGKQNVFVGLLLILKIVIDFLKVKNPFKWWEPSGNDA